MTQGDNSSTTANTSIRRISWLLFFSLWLAYGVLINSSNLEAFTLQQAAPEAYVERGHLYIEGSTVPRLQIKPVVDAFLYDEHVYPGKQPGQFMIGALIYAMLYTLGISYSGNYLLAAALVTFLTASLVTAAASIAVLRIARVFVGDKGGMFWPIIAALSYGLGSTALAYSGIAWHDSLSAGYLTIALCLMFYISRAGVRMPSAAAFAAGSLLGLTVTTSMLPALMVAMAVIYFLALKRWRLVPFLVIGIAIGLGPLLAYDTEAFGDPLILPNVAGQYKDIWLTLSWTNLVNKAIFYLRMLTLYTPIFWLGLCGLMIFRRELRREQFLLLTMLAVLVAYVLDIEATGTCQWGPRYLLPAMPVAAIGLAGFARFGWTSLGMTLAVLVVACAFLSAAFNFIGAEHGAMVCDFPEWAVAAYGGEIFWRQSETFPLARWLAVPLLAVALLLCRELAVVHRTASRTGADVST